MTEPERLLHRLLRAKAEVWRLEAQAAERKADAWARMAGEAWANRPHFRFPEVTWAQHARDRHAAMSMKVERCKKAERKARAILVRRFGEEGR